MLRQECRCRVSRGAMPCRNPRPGGEQIDVEPVAIGSGPRRASYWCNARPSRSPLTISAMRRRRAGAGVAALGLQRSPAFDEPPGAKLGVGSHAGLLARDALIVSPAAASRARRGSRSNAAVRSRAAWGRPSPVRAWARSVAGDVASFGVAFGRNPANYHVPCRAPAPPPGARVPGTPRRSAKAPA